MRDVVVLEQLRNKGMIALPYNELLPYEAMERRARILDKPPKPLTLKKIDEINPCGTAQKFVMVYNSLIADNSIEIGTLDLRGYKRYCDVSVFYTLQSLVRLSIGKSVDLVKAAGDIFRVLVTHQCDTLTEKIMYDVLMNYTPINFYASELVSGISIAVYNEATTSIYWKSLCEFIGLYTEVIQPGMKVIKDNCSTEKDVRSFCTKLYKEAKADEDFMSKIYKKGVNKYIIAMLYYLYPTNPKLVDNYVIEGGFSPINMESDE